MRADIHTIEDVTRRTFEELSEIRNLGIGGIGEITSILNRYGLTLSAD